MPGELYRIASIGTRVPLDQGVSETYKTTIDTYAKPNTLSNPYCVANEFICGSIGRMIGLPVPPVGLVTSGDGIVFVASLDFNLEGDTLPPVNPLLCCKKLPNESTGLILFDALVMNKDRHHKNFAISIVENKPPKMSIFDHSHALCGPDANQGMKRLAEMRERLAITGTIGFTGGNRHWLLDWLDTTDFLKKWVERIGLIPNYFIEDIVEKLKDQITEPGLPELIVETLIYRKDNLTGILNTHHSEFKKLNAQWVNLP